MKMFKPADIIGVAIYPIGSTPERKIVYRKKYRWRWLATFDRNALGWNYDGYAILIFHVVEPGATGGHLLDGVP